MVWKFTGDRPVYQQIMAQVRGAVIAGTLAPGERLLPIRTMAAQARVNPNTMQRALQELEQDGLLVTHSTSGRFVTQDRQVIGQAREAVIRELVDQCASQFRELGISPAQAALLLQAYEERKD